MPKEGLQLMSRAASALLVTAFILVPAPVETQEGGWSASQTPVVERAVSTTATCQSSTPILAPLDSLGPIKPGMTVADLRRICDSLDYVWMSRGGQTNPALVTRLGEVTILIELLDTTDVALIYRMSTMSPAARTVDGIGPGLDVATLVSRWPEALASDEGGGFRAYSSSGGHQGMSLSISFPDSFDRAQRRRLARSDDWSLAPPEARTSLMLLTRWYVPRRLPPF